MASDVTRIIGIDFGTSTSVVRVKRYKNGEPVGDSYSSVGVTFGNGESDTKAVTAVRLNADGSLTCGREGLEPTPDSTVYQEFKMNLESPDAEKQCRARELTEAYFQYLYQWYDHQHSDLGEADDTETTIVSFPVKWQEETRQFMVNAAADAGFKNVTAMDEASAALYATLCRKMNDINDKGILRIGEPGYLLLADMGAGTTDLAVCRYTVDSTGGVIRPGQIKNEIVATWPEDASAPTFGGREVDRILEDFLTRYIQDCGLDAGMARQLVTGNSSVKPWKENAVSLTLNQGKQVETCAFLNGYMMLLPNKKPFPAFGRGEFEAMLGDKLEQFKTLAAGCLHHAAGQEPELLAKGLDLVILTGGHSSWYFAEELLNGDMPGLALPQLERVQKEKARVMRLSNPQETVALGLVYSRLPLKVEDKKKEAEETLKKVREEAEKKAASSSPTAEEAGQSPGGGQPANGEAMLDAASTFLAEWSLRRELSGWEISGVFFGTLRWNSKNGNGQSVSVTVSEDGISAHSVNKPGNEEYDISVSWDKFLSGQARHIGNFVELRLPGQKEIYLVAITNGTVLDHMVEFFTQLQATLQLKQSGAAHIWDDRLTEYIAQYLKRHAESIQGDWYEVTAMNRFRSCLKIPDNEEIYLAHDDTILKSGKNGFALCGQGIYTRELWGTPQFVSWEEFFNAEIEKNWTLVLPGRRVWVYQTNTKPDKSINTLLPDLQAYLRQQLQFLHPREQ